MAGDHRQDQQDRVIWVNRFFYPDESATSIMLTDLVRQLAATGAGHEHHLVTSTARYAGGAEDGGAGLPGVIVHRIPALGRGNDSLLLRLANFLLFYTGALLLLLRYARRADTIVALTDPPLVGTVAALAARLKGAWLMHWVQDIFPETASRLGFAREGGVLEGMLVRLRNAAWQRAGRNVVIGERMRDFLVVQGIRPERIAVIPNWADETAIRPVPPSANPLRAEWGYAPEHCVIGYSGNLGRAHDVATKVAAMEHLRAAGPANLRFLFIGGGARQGELRRLAGEGDDGLLAFRPYQPMAMLANSLSVPDVHWISLLPRLEGLIVPSKLYGVLAAGRPVVFIGDPRGEVARLLAEGECGASFAPGEADTLARYLARLAQDPGLRAELGARARSLAEDHLHRQGRAAAWRARLRGDGTGEGGK
ncbi:glycosyltransferase family 4 protein [Alteraurantiacibacter buctensis]|uniref:Glycosyltransferase n=1 Tax=Alteraurantiacibacter buctensis TaxID=1503981 RepID=A0A844Z146_9SPHN|nr:glycosyltransferase family 4 protein [Alteraurantiacibacter buctensis]MXO71623.1 glycosyltransferase [Alteraurantiacibacter buctensis]